MLAGVLVWGAELRWVRGSCPVPLPSESYPSDGRLLRWGSRSAALWERRACVCAHCPHRLFLSPSLPSPLQCFVGDTLVGL